MRIADYKLKKQEDMKKIAFTLIALMLLISMTACSMVVDGINTKRVTASNNYVTKEYKLTDFNKISLAGSGNVYFTQRPGTPTVSVVTSDNIAELLEVYVENNTLTIKFKKGYSINNRGKLDFTIHAENLTSMGIAGSGDFKLMNGLTTDNLKLSVAGSGNMDCNNIQCQGDVKVSIAGSGDIEAHNLKCNAMEASVAGSGNVQITGIESQQVKASISGSGDFILQGNTRQASYSIAGSGDIDAQNLVAEDVNASSSGSGDITCHAKNSIKARKTGSGSIGYKGNPSTVDIGKKDIYPIN